MSNLKQLRDRVKSIKSTQKITKAMNVVSAAKLKKIKDVDRDTSPYSEVLRKIMHHLTKDIVLYDLAPKDAIFFDSKLMDKPCLLVVVTSERGLCGSLNSSIIRMVKKDIRELRRQGKKLKLIVIGKKGIDSLKKDYEKLVESYINNTKDKSFFIAQVVKNKILTMVKEGKVGTCHIYHNKFHNAMTQIATKSEILPIEREKYSPKLESKELMYEYEGDSLIQKAIDFYISSRVNHVLLQNRLSEEGARMTAMSNATNNAGEMIDKLTLQLNRSRQAAVTMELAEIISGSESLN